MQKGNVIQLDENDIYWKGMQVGFESGLEVCRNFITWYGNYSTSSAFNMKKAFDYYLENVNINKTI